jgi:hypothetical protein
VCLCISLKTWNPKHWSLKRCQLFDASFSTTSRAFKRAISHLSSHRQAQKALIWVRLLMPFLSPIGFVGSVCEPMAILAFHSVLRASQWELTFAFPAPSCFLYTIPKFWVRRLLYLSPAYELFSCLPPSSTLKNQTIYSSETFADFQRTCRYVWGEEKTNSFNQRVEKTRWIYENKWIPA